MHGLDHDLAELRSIDVETAAFDAAALAQLPADIARHFSAIPIRFRDGRLELAIADLLDLAAIDALSHLVAPPVDFVQAPAAQICAAIERCYPNVAPPATGSPAPDAGLTESEPGLVRLVESILQDAIRRRASDIHFEPLAKRFRIRLRIDGALLDVEAPPQKFCAPIISRLKIMAGISIAERRVPQDGRISLQCDGRQVDLRAATLPTVHGESIVLRIIESGSLLVDLPQLGLLDDHRAMLEKMLAASDGMLLVTGPTGCGKSTTLYSCLQRLNEVERKVIAVEDPVELRLRGITQVSARADLGLDFAAALRAMLRQAPNAIMVGEIRDRETAEIALNASLTGHLVLSTLHTNDAPSAITRLVDLGIKPFLVAAGLRAVVAQRLVRRVCPGCARLDDPGTMLRHRTIGCAQCHGTGFRGRLGVFEMFLMSEPLRALVHANASATRLRGAARAEGMISLREDGIRKVLARSTTIDEVLCATTGDADQPQPYLTS